MHKTDSENDYLETSWFGDFIGESKNLNDSLGEIKKFAYWAFDALDKDGNGFLETMELQSALAYGQLSQREKSFVAFLLSNQEHISESYEEENSSNFRNGISRHDIESYFDLILSMF